MVKCLIEPVTKLNVLKISQSADFNEKQIHKKHRPSFLIR